MKSREILLVVLVVAIALASGLVGIYVGRLSTEQVAVSGPAEGVSGASPVSFGGDQLKLWTNPQQTGDPAFTIEAGKIYEGTPQQGQTVLFFDGVHIYRGSNTTGEMLFTLEGNRLFVGGNTTGAVAYTFENGHVFAGETTAGDTLYTIEGDQMFAGANTAGPVVFKGNQDLTGNIWAVLAVLDEQRY
jgi:hypothetical protein